MAYFFTCNNKATIVSNGGKVIENSDGTVSVFLNVGTPILLPLPMTKPCCQILDPSYIFDENTQKCRWSQSNGGNDGCEIQPFKVVLNPKGNDGVIFTVDENDNENCTLDISFDYLMQFDCEDITNKLISSQPTGLSEAQLNYEDCLTEKANNEATLFNLQTQLVSTPYVVECTAPVAVAVVDNFDSGNGVLAVNFPGLDGSFSGVDVADGGDVFIGNISDNISDVDAGGSDAITFTLGCTDPTSPNYNHLATADDGSCWDDTIVDTTTNTYCLTAAGLQAWENILGTNVYNSWLNSNGTDTSLYGCEAVNQLIEQSDISERLGGEPFFSICNVTITARQVLIQSITDLQAVIDGSPCIEPIIEDISCTTVSEMLETLNVCMTLDMVNPSTGKLETVYEESILNIGDGNLPTYLEVNQPNTGLLSSGATGTTFCENVAKQLMTELEAVLPNSGTTEIQNLVQNSLNSEWLNFETSITDQSILNMIYNEKIKISLYIKDCCVDFGILIDRITLDKNCVKVDASSTTISKSPSFDMIRVCDNKKSWLSNEEFKHREFDLKLRDTQYDINNYKLAINSKEVNLDINPANAIEQDLFCYIQDNPCLLDCSTGGTSSIDVDTSLDFEGILSAETISCDESYTSACTVDSQWNISVILGCETIYNNNNFYTSSGITDVPSQTQYITELNNIATALDLAFTTGATSVTFTHTIDCDEISFLDKTFSVNLGLDITTNC